MKTIALRVLRLASLVLLATVRPAVAQDRPQDAQIRMAKEAWEMAADEGWIEGIRHGDLIRPDLLSVTIDGGVLGALDPGNDAGIAALGDPADFQKPQAFRISIRTALDGRRRELDLLHHRLKELSGFFKQPPSVTGRPLWRSDPDTRPAGLSSEDDVTTM